METVRIFISSPGDVAEERDRARDVVEQLRRRYAGRLDLKAVLWEDLPLTADISFQQGIDLVLSERGADIAVFILWSRLGSPLGALVRKPDGTDYRSGTEREWDLMWQACEKSGGQRPRIIVYTRRDESSFDERLRGLPTAEKNRLIQQKTLLEQFITEEFKDQDTKTNIRAYHPFEQPATFAQRLRIHLQELLDGLAGGDLAAPVWDIEKKGPPFLGLETFKFEHAAVFFGREDEIAAVRHLLREQARRGCAFVLIAGASGSGKSSLARGGVLPAIAAHEIDSEVAGWHRAILSPGEGDGGLLLTLAEALTAENALPALRCEPDSLAQLAGDLARDPEMVCRRVLRPALETTKRRERIIVLVDQFEELFTDPRITSEARGAFVRALEALARSGFAWVVATVRSDFYAQCQSLEALVRMKEGGGQFDLVPPGADALDRLIRQPAVLAGLHFEQRGDTSLADVILRDATAHRELLPLLEYLLQRLCAERTAEGMLTFASYERLGGVEGALAQRADAVIAELKPTESTLDSLLSALVTLSGDEKESFVRRRAPRAELERDEASRALVARLIDERLLTSSAPPGGEAIVTVTHEALLRVWSTAVAWLGRNREFLRLRANVTQSFTRWREAKEDGSLLLPPGLLLEEARRLLGIENGRLETAVRGYVETSLVYRREEQLRSIRRQRLVLASLSLLTLFAIIGAIFAIRGYRESAYNLIRANHEKQHADQEKQHAEIEATNARSQAKAAQDANEKNLKTLHEASMADYAVAVQRINNDNWSEGVARLGRALDWEPGNLLAAARLYSTLSLGSRKNWPDLILRHENWVESAQFSPDGSRIVTASLDHTARVWDAATGKALGEPMRHEDTVEGAQFSPDGTRIVTASDDKTARVWDAVTGKALGEPLRHTSSVMGAQFSPDGTRIVTASSDKTARVWDAATGKAIGEPLRHEDRVVGAQFSPDGTRIVTASHDKTARVWDAVTGNPLGEPLRHEDQVYSAQFSPDGTRIVTASYDKTARVWDAATGKPVGEPLRHEGSVNSAQFSPDGFCIVTASSDKTARIWDAATGKPVGKPLRHEDTVWSAQFSPDSRLIVTLTLEAARVWNAFNGIPAGELLHHELRVTSAQFSPDSTRIVTASWDNTARVWYAATTKCHGEPLRHEDGVANARFSPDGTRIVTASWDKTARVWDTASGTPLSEPLRHEGQVYSAQFSPDGTRIVTASYDKTARVWDATTGKAIGEPLRHEDIVWSAQFSLDGTRIVTASYDKTARVWDAATGKALGEPLRHQDKVLDAEFSPDGTRIVTASYDKTARVWDAATSKPLGEPFRHGDKVWSAQFSPDGSRIVTAGYDKTARVWDATTGKAIGEPLRHGDKVWSAQFSPDGSRIVTASGDYTARVWDTTTGKAIGEPLRHASAVYSAQFSPDGTRIVTASNDRYAQVWDAATGKALGEPLQHEDPVRSAQFSPDGTRIVTTCNDRTARVWGVAGIVHPPVPVPEWMRERARAAAGLEIDLDGELRSIPVEKRLRILQQPPPGEDAWAVLARWLASPAERRTLTPDSHFTCRQIAERERDFGTIYGFGSALIYDATVPLAHLLFTGAAINEDAKKKSSERAPGLPAWAAFYRNYDLKHLPDDPALWAWASAILLEQKVAKTAVEAGRKAVALDEKLPAAQRALARALEVNGQRQEAFETYEKFLPSELASFADFDRAGYLAALLGHGDRAREIFRAAGEKFPKTPSVRRVKGWALINLNAPSEALDAFESYESLLPPGDKPESGAIAGRAVSRWLTGDKDGAVADYQRLIAMAPVYADAEALEKFDDPETVKKLIREVLVETLKRHPELKPKPAEIKPQP